MRGRGLSSQAEAKGRADLRKASARGFRRHAPRVNCQRMKLRQASGRTQRDLRGHRSDARVADHVSRPGRPAEPGRGAREPGGAEGGAPADSAAGAAWGGGAPAHTSRRPMGPTPMARGPCSCSTSSRARSVRIRTRLPPSPGPSRWAWAAPERTLCVGRARGEQNADGTYHGHAAILFFPEFLGAEELGAVDTNPGETKEASPLDFLPFEELCMVVPVCIEALTSKSSTTTTGSTNSTSLAQVLHLPVPVRRGGAVERQHHPGRRLPDRHRKLIAGEHSCLLPLRRRVRFPARGATGQRRADDLEHRVEGLPQRNADADQPVAR